MSERGRAAIALGLWPLADIHFDVTNIRSWG